MGQKQRLNECNVDVSQLDPRCKVKGFTTCQQMQCMEMLLLPHKQQQFDASAGGSFNRPEYKQAVQEDEQQRKQWHESQYNPSAAYAHYAGVAGTDKALDCDHADLS